MTDAAPGAVTVRPLRDDEVSGLIALFRRCYGDSYGNRMFYDADALAAARAAGTLRSVVAVGPDGALLGHTAISVPHPGARVCETGNTVVDPAARGRGLLRLLGDGLRERVLGDGFAGYVHYPTTAHQIMQRASVARGGHEVGVMLAYIAESTEYAAVPRSAGRLAATVVYQPLRPLPARTVRLPRRYRALIEALYAEAGLARTASPADGSASGRAGLQSAWNAPRGLLRIGLDEPGADTGEAVAALMSRFDPAVTHLDLPLDQPAADAVLDALAALGFVFCALLPEFAHTDVLRLQALRDPSERAFRPDVTNPRAVGLCALMRREAGLRV